MGQDFCVWVRVASDDWIEDRDGAVNLGGSDVQGSDAGGSGFSGLRGGRVDRLGLMAAPLDSPLRLLSGRRPPMQARSAIVTGSFDERFDGLRGDGQWVDCVFIKGDEAAAIEWIGSPAGRVFVESAKNFFLLRVGSAMVDELQVPNWEVPDLHNAFPGGVFCEKHWCDQFRPLHLSPAPLLPEDWRRRIQALERPSVDYEQDKQDVQASADVRKSQLQDIVKEARSARDAIQSVHAVLQLPRTPELSLKAERLIHMVIENIDAPVFWLKRRYLRERPATALEDKGFKPMFAPSSPYHPGHPSYPAGHATVAYALAHVYAHFASGKKQALLEAAGKVAQRRVIAGLHFPTDIQGGAILGKWIADQLVQSDDLQRLASELNLQTAA